MVLLLVVVLFYCYVRGRLRVRKFHKAGITAGVVAVMSSSVHEASLISDVVYVASSSATAAVQEEPDATSTVLDVEVFIAKERGGGVRL